MLVWLGILLTFTGNLTPPAPLPVPNLPGLRERGSEVPGKREVLPYPSYADMLAKIDEWKRRYPHLIHETTLGKTVEGRAIPLLRLSDDNVPDPTEPGVMMVAGIHPRESQPPVCLLWLTEELLSRYGKDDRITKLLKERQIYFVPMLNVDGKLYDETAKPPKPGQDWRKNRRKIPGSSRVGVDLNRNFPVRWGGFRETDTLWNDRTNRPGGNIYEGPRSLSEPESKALADFFATHATEVRLFVDLHSPLRKTLFPNYLYGADATRYETLASGIRRLQKDRPYPTTVIKRDTQPPAGFRTGNTGLSYTYAYYVYGIYGFNIEIGLSGEKNDADTSGDLIGRHYPPIAGVLAEYKANIRDPLLYLLEAAGDLPASTQKELPLSPVESDGALLPGATVALKPVLTQPPGFAVLTSENPNAVVQSEIRSVPLETGFTVHIAENAKLGTEIPFTLTVWDGNRNRSVIRLLMNVARPAMIPKDENKQ